MSHETLSSGLALMNSQLSLPVQGQNSSVDRGEDHKAPLLAEKLLAVSGYWEWGGGSFFFSGVEAIGKLFMLQ